nr:probable serine/threonine-protein kinase DDB_G0282963 isoform X1 [Ipomoea batatas]
MSDATAAAMNPQFQSGKPSLHASEYGNLSSNLGISELGLNSGLLDVRNDFGTVHDSDWNLTGSGSKSQAVESSSTEWNTDLNNLLLDQTGLSSNTSVDVTNLSERSEDSLIGSTTGGLSSDITPSRLSFSGWGFDYGEFGSTSKTSNSTFSGFNSNSDALVFGCANALLFTSLIFTSEAQEIHETKAFGNDSNRLLHLFPMSNGSDEADSHGHYTGDMKAYSVGTDNGSNGYLNSDLRGHDTSNIMAYSYGNVSNHSIDIFSMSNGTDLEVLDTGDMKAFSSAFSNGSVITNESVKAKPEARDTNELKTNLLGYSESDNHSIDLFAIANGISGIIHENEVENNKPSTSAQNSFIPDSYSEKSVSNGIADLIPVVEGVETDEDFGEFTGALSDSGSKQEGELKDTDLSHELEAAKSGNKHQVNVIGSNHKGALPLSIFGDEELETDASSTVEDGFICHPFPKIDKKQEPVISINDLISSLYSQAEHTSSINSLQNHSDVVEPPDSGASSNLVNDEDAFGDESWEYKGGIPQGTENKTSIFHHGDSLPSSLSIRKLDNYVDFYSELKKELSLYSKYHLGNPQEAGKELDLEGYICEEDDLEGHPSWETCFHEFIEVLRKPKFQVLESEYNLSRRLSQMENDFNSAVELINLASIMLRLLTFASAKEQLIYVSVWYKMFSVCTQELKHGTWLWKQISDNDAQSYMFSNTRGRQYILGLVEIYKVAVVLGASVKLYQPWTWLNSVDFTGIYLLLDECHALWSRLGLEQAILNTSDPASTGTIRLSLDNIKSIHDLDAFALQNHIFRQKEVICRLSLLTSEVVNGMKLVIWNGEQYLLTLANLWANLISNDPPELPHLSFGW